MNSNDPKKLIIQGVFLLLGLIYLSRLFYIQIIDDVSSNEIRRKMINPPRGLIYDRNGVLMVANQPVYDIWVKPNEVAYVDSFRLARFLGLDTLSWRKHWAKVNEQIKKGRKKRWEQQVFVHQLSQERYSRLQEHIYEFDGFTAKLAIDRYYPNPAAAHMLGYIAKTNAVDLKSDRYYNGQDYIGRRGLERSYEKELRGQKGFEFILKDVKGKISGAWENGKYDTMPLPGKDLHTTIDVRLQQYGEALMKNKLGSIVAIEPKTGEILAIVSSPTYDPGMMVGRVRSENYSILLQDTLKPLYNRALMARYPPGSTFKILMSLIGLKEGVVGEYEHIKCMKDHKKEGMVTCHDHKERIDGIRTAIKFSCNTYYSQLFKKIIGQKKYHGNTEEAYNQWRDYLISFGLNQQLNEEGFSERSGWVPQANVFNKLYGSGRWKAPTIISLSVGQGELLLTPLQIANMYSVVANKGYYITPHIVKKVGEDLAFEAAFYERKYTPIEEKYFEPIMEGLEEVMEEGTGKTSKIEGIRMGGKTGTAENPHGEDHSVFAGIAPLDHPEIAICVFVENSGYGSAWAAPIASLMTELYLVDSISDKRKWLEKKMLEGSLIK